MTTSYSREYEVVIYDDGSTDGTRETLAPYADVIPLTIIGSSARQGYGHALDALVRHVTTKTRYPRRDAMIVMQGDLRISPTTSLNSPSGSKAVPTSSSPSARR